MPTHQSEQYGGGVGLGNSAQFQQSKQQPVVGTNSSLQGGTQLSSNASSDLTKLLSDVNELLNKANGSGSQGFSGGSGGSQALGSAPFARNNSYLGDGGGGGQVRVRQNNKKSLNFDSLGYNQIRETIVEEDDSLLLESQQAGRKAPAKKKRAKATVLNFSPSDSEDEGLEDSRELFSGVSGGAARRLREQPSVAAREKSLNASSYSSNQLARATSAQSIARAQFGSKAQPRVGAFAQNPLNQLSRNEQSYRSQASVQYRSNTSLLSQQYSSAVQHRSQQQQRRQVSSRGQSNNSIIAELTSPQALQQQLQLQHQQLQDVVFCMMCEEYISTELVDQHSQVCKHKSREVQSQRPELTTVEELNERIHQIRRLVQKKQAFFLQNQHLDNVFVKLEEHAVFIQEYCQQAATSEDRNELLGVLQGLRIFLKRVQEIETDGMAVMLVEFSEKLRKFVDRKLELVGGAQTDQKSIFGDTANHSPQKVLWDIDNLSEIPLYNSPLKAKPEPVVTNRYQPHSQRLASIALQDDALEFARHQLQQQDQQQYYIQQRLQQQQQENGAPRAQPGHSKQPSGDKKGVQKYNKIFNNSARDADIDSQPGTNPSQRGPNAVLQPATQNFVRFPTIDSYQTQNLVPPERILFTQENSNLPGFDEQHANNSLAYRQYSNYGNNQQRQSKLFSNSKKESDRKQFFELAATLKKDFPADHPANQVLLAELYQLAVNQNVQQQSWQNFIRSHYGSLR